MENLASKAAFTISMLVALLAGCCPRVSMIDVGPLAKTRALDCLTTAHRGVSLRAHDGLGSLPDNSLEALRESVARAVPLVEVDVRRSMEGDLFLFHDGSLSSANSYSPRHLRGIPMSRLTRQERAGVTLDPQGKILIPTLNDALSVVANSGTALQVDFKGESDELAFAALELISKRKLLAQVVFQIRSAERADAIKRRYPHARILVRCLNYEQLEQALRVGVEFVELERWVSSEAIASAHARGVKVLANIASSRLDESTTWHYLRSRGIDVIMSDRAREHECRRRSS